MPKLALLGGKPVRTKPFPIWPQYGAAEERQLMQVLYKAKWGIGKRVGKVTQFEEKFARYHEAAYGVCCTNCSHALEVMLSVCGIGAGDEVIVPSYTFIATASAVTMTGAIPVFADIRMSDYTVDPKCVESLITKRTKAIIPVHFAGHFANMNALRRIARKHKLVLIEDAAQAHGGKWGGKYAGSFGLGAGFSFQYSKNITAGEGGIILTNDRDFWDRCWQYIWHGRVKGGIWYETFRATSNYRITEWQAAVLLGQLGKLKRQTAKRHANGKLLDKKLAGIPGVKPLTVSPKMNPHPRHLYITRFLEEEFDGIPKDRIVAALEAEGIPALPGYAFPLYRTPAFRDAKFGPKSCQMSCKRYPKKIDYRKAHNPNAEKACRESVWLLHSNLLGTKKDMGDIAAAIAKVAENRDELRGT